MPHHVDAHVGRRIRHRRWNLRMTQQELADHLGVKFQQIQKYESGANRVSSSRLWDIAAALSVPVSFLFEGLEMQTPVGGARRDVLSDNETLTLLRSYYRIPVPQRRRLFDLARVLACTA